MISFIKMRKRAAVIDDILTVLFILKKVVSWMAKGYRPDQNGTHRAQFDKNKKKIYATQTV